MEGSPEHPRTRWEQEKGILCSMTGSGGPHKSARRLGCSGAPQGSAPSGGCGGVPRAACFPQRVMFGTSPAPLVAMETKQGRWRRPERGWAGACVCVGGGEVGLADCCLGNGNRGAPPPHPGHGLSASTPQCSQSSPRSLAGPLAYSCPWYPFPLY